MKQVTFVDHATIKLKSGNGGDGKMGFHKEKYIEQGGPSGGNGGNGGSIYLIASSEENTLLNYKGKSLFIGNDGENGGLKNMTGANGKDIYLKVPIGTEIVIDGKIITDLQFEGQIWLAAKGGKGGRGNKSFKSSKNTAPTLFENGEKTVEQTIDLNLKVLADVGLLGYPNSGKSTLVSKITNAHPKIADYKFTTLSPQLGVVENYGTSFIVADLPGLIDGASEDKGMGIQFLKHLSRTKIIIHLIDSTSLDNVKIRYKNIRRELRKSKLGLCQKSEVIVFSKSDLIDDEIKTWIKNEFKSKKTFFISSKTNDGLKELVDHLSIKIRNIRKKEEKFFENLLLENEDNYEIYKIDDNDDKLLINFENGVWIISNKFTQFWGNRIPLTSNENTWRLISKLKSKGIIDELKSKGMKPGDLIMIKKTPFIVEYVE